MGENSGLVIPNIKYKECVVCHRVFHRRIYNKHSRQCYIDENRPTASEEQVNLFHVGMSDPHANHQHI